MVNEYNVYEIKFIFCYR